ncbi:MAG: alpha/beta hydrolase [Burkholderiales bacterium]|nr:alpha/beta hydrolase [Burkholderiales bacterium]
MSYYTDAPRGQPAARPLLLVHSVNAAASAYEVRPVYEHYRATRPVYAPDLPGFGFSDRSDREYTPRLMTDAVHAVREEITRAHGPGPVDALAVSLGCEFLARAAVETPAGFASLALVSPTGFDGGAPRLGPEGSHRGMPWLRAAFTFPLWSEAFFRALTSRASIRFFLAKTWGSAAIDAGLAEYDWLTARQPGARHAPYFFVSGFLFSNDSGRVYRSLAQPVWMSHGVRGDFTDYRGKRAFEERPNWRFTVFDTGALPHFEAPRAFLAAYDAFLAR